MGKAQFDVESIGREGFFDFGRSTWSTRSDHAGGQALEFTKDFWDRLNGGSISYTNETQLHSVSFRDADNGVMDEGSGQAPSAFVELLRRIMDRDR